ncbi:MAG: acyl-CoA dehydrogenase family protein [Pseudolabrys sp.]|jgi:butyryl-CoA dehydrogenase
MYNLHLSAEQLEIRDTVRDFVNGEIKPVVLKADRLDAADRTLPMGLLDKASQMGLRTLALSEALGGAGADHLTACIVAEELAVGDPDIAAGLMETSRLGHILFDHAMSDAQRDKLLPKFLTDDRFHLAFAQREPDSDTKLGVNYHRPAVVEVPVHTTAAKAGNGDWIVNGTKVRVANAPIARLIAVEAAIAGRAGTAILLVPADAPGVSVRVPEKTWHHGPCGEVTFKDCRLPPDHLLGGNTAALVADTHGRGIPLAQALNLGIARAAHEAAIDYGKLRVQGGRPIIEHQAIGTKLAECAIKLEVARAAVWQAAWASDHPEGYADRSLPDLPLQTVAQVFTAEMMLKATKDAVEVFGAMGVMRDMPLQKYVNDARVCLHSGDGNTDAKLRIAEALAGYRRAVNGGAYALAGE